MTKTSQSIRFPGSLFCLLLLTCLATTASAGNWIDLVSVSSTGEQGDSHTGVAAISADGRFVLLGSDATNLVATNVYFQPEIYLRDTLTGITTRVSGDSAGGELLGTAQSASISSDGGFIAFSSNAPLLVPGDTNNTYDVFVRERTTGMISRVSVDSAGVQGNAESSFSAISGDDRYVAFSSRATNLVSGGTSPSQTNIFVHDRNTAITSLVSVDSAGNEGNGGAGVFTISSDGRYVAFASQATNLVPGGTTANRTHVFVHDRNTATTSLVSADSAGNEGGDAGNGQRGFSSRPSISDDGRYIIFDSSSTNLVVGDTNDRTDVFLRDTLNGTTTRLSVDSAGNQAINGGYAATVSGDLRYVAFLSSSPDLVGDDGNGAADIFVHDRNTGTTARFSVSEAGIEANSQSSFPFISSDGHYVAFSSFANNLVTGDANARTDGFIKAIPEVKVTSVVPNSLPRGVLTSVTINGTSFLPGAIPDLGGAQTSTVAVVDENTITVDVTVPTGAPVGAQDVSVSLPGTGPGPQTGAVGECVDCVTFEPPPCSGCGCPAP